MLISMKAMRVGFINTHLPEKYIVLDGYGDTTIAGVRSSIIRSKKFVVGHELLAMDIPTDGIMQLLYGKDAQEHRFVPENKREKLFAMWKQFAKLPYPEVFIENTTGGILLQDINGGILCTVITAEGSVIPARSFINSHVLDTMSIAAMVINHDFLVLSKDIPEGHPSNANKQDLINCAKLDGLIVLNALTYINSKNISIEKYNMSNKEAENKVSKSLREKYTYHVVDIFHKRKKYERLSDVEEYANTKMTSNIRAHMVRGHFKQKKSGLYWWNPFLRCKKNEGFVDKDYAVH